MARLLSELAVLVHGKLVGDGDPWIEGASVLGESSATDITLVDRPENLPRLIAGSAAAAVVPEGTPILSVPTIQVADVHVAFAAIIQIFRPRRTVRRGGIHPAAQVSPTAQIAADVEIAAGAFIDDDVKIAPHCVIHSGVRILAGSQIGEGTTLYPNAVLYEDTVVGPRCIIHAGAVIGSFGFGYRQNEGRHRLTAQLGFVRIEADVEIGANSTIDRGSYGATIIGEGTKIDNQVQIGHNCQIGRHNLICAQVGIAGSTSTGDYVVMAGQVGVRDHVHIGAGAVLGAMSGITNDVMPAARMMGIPATPEREQKLKLAALAKLPEMRKELKALTATVAKIEAQLNQAAAAVITHPRGEAA